MPKRFNKNEKIIRDAFKRYWKRPNGVIIRQLADVLCNSDCAIVALSDNRGSVYIRPHSVPSLDELKFTGEVTGFFASKGFLIPMSEAGAHTIVRIWKEKVCVS